jgi:hypothetical protein
VRCDVALELRFETVEGGGNIITDNAAHTQDVARASDPSCRTNSLHLPGATTRKVRLRAGAALQSDIGSA